LVKDENDHLGACTRQITPPKIPIANTDDGQDRRDLMSSIR
jgi:hypothetical protein